MLKLSRVALLGDRASKEKLRLNEFIRVGLRSDGIIVFMRLGTREPAAFRCTQTGPMHTAKGVTRHPHKRPQTPTLPAP